jgi:hypothetical protein
MTIDALERADTTAGSFSYHHPRGEREVRGLLRLALLGIAFSVPLESAANLPAVGSLPKLFTGLGFALVVFESLSRRWIRTTGWVGRFLILHLCWIAVGLTWTKARNGEGDFLFNVLLQLVLLSVVIVQGLTTQKSRREFAAAFGIGSALASVFIIINWINDVPYRGTDLKELATKQNTGEIARFTLGGEDPNFMAMVLVIGLVLLWAAASRSPKRWPKIMALACSGVTVYAILLTGSRGSGVLTPLAIAVYVASRVLRKAGKAIVAAVVGGIVIYSAWAILPVNTQVRLTTSLDSNTATAKLREDLWRAARDNIKKRPLLGYGAGSSRYVIGGQVGRSLVVHNTPLSILLEGGMIDFTLIAGIGVMLLVRSQKLDRATRTATRATMIAAGVSSLFIGADYKKAFVLVFALAAAEVCSQPDAPPADTTVDEATSLDRWGNPARVETSVGRPSIA